MRKAKVLFIPLLTLFWSQSDAQTSEIRKSITKALSVFSFVAFVFAALSADPPRAIAIELIPVCKESFERFEEWSQHYKVFAYGFGGGRAGCTMAIGEDEALKKCIDMLKVWGGACQVYAKSPVNGKLAIVWKDAKTSNSKVERPGQKVEADQEKRRQAEAKRNAEQERLRNTDEKKRSFLECFNNPKLCEQEQLVQSKSLRDRRTSLETEQVERDRQSRVEEQLARERKNSRILLAKEGHERKLEQAKKREAEERRQRDLILKQKTVDAHERKMLPIRKKNRRSFAVIIGNKNYGGRVPIVDFAHNDADAMKRFIINKLGFREGNIYDLRDAGVNAISAVLGNEKSHEGDLFNAIRKGQSDVIVYYSGHGVPGLKDGRPYLLPVDGDPNSAEITGYSIDTMYTNLARLSARSVTVFLDACFSGESEKGMLVSNASGISVKPKMPSSKGQMTVITAAQGNQLASWDTKSRHGLFTKHLLDALSGEADSKDYGNYDGKVSLSEIHNYLDEEMTYQARATWKRRQNAFVRGSGDTILSTVFRVP